LWLKYAGANVCAQKKLHRLARFETELAADTSDAAPDGAWKSFLAGGYKDAAPTALGLARHRPSGTKEMFCRPYRDLEMGLRFTQP
jgi:hypothetical protein